MKILIYSPSFYPNVGGLETVTSDLAHEFIAQGQEVKIVSQTPANDDQFFPFEVIRKPSPQQLLKLTRWCDVYFQPNISLKGIWPLIFYPRPWVVSHNGWYTRTDGSYGWQDYLKHFIIRFATGISVSQAVANHVSTPSTVIPNSYADDVFYEMPNIARNRELVFLGRLVSDKGVDLLIAALAKLKQMGLTPKLTIIGQGPESNNLHQQVKELGVTAQVKFVGVKVKQELAQILNAHKIMVVPSRCQEGFGIVALEGIACGCVVVGAEVGGLKEAIGTCGVTFPHEDVQTLTQTLFNLLQNPEQLTIYRQHATSHLLRHQRTTVAKAYLHVIESTLEQKVMVNRKLWKYQSK
jgi:glycogen synthase